MSTITERSGNGSAVIVSQNESVNTNGVKPNNNDSNITKNKEPPARSRRPSDVALLQQRMKSWQPLLDPKWVIASYLLIGIVFIPVGESTEIEIEQEGCNILKVTVEETQKHINRIFVIITIYQETMDLNKYM